MNVLSSPILLLVPNMVTTSTIDAILQVSLLIQIVNEAGCHSVKNQRVPSPRSSEATESKEGRKVDPIDSLGRIQKLLDQADDQVGQNSQHRDQKTLLILVGLGVFTLVISYDETLLLQIVNEVVGNSASYHAIRALLSALGVVWLVGAWLLYKGKKP